MYDFLILHRNCGCVSDGYISDEFYALQECKVCSWPYGFGTPIVLVDGRFTSHLSCCLGVDGICVE